MNDGEQVVAGLVIVVLALLGIGGYAGYRAFTDTDAGALETTAATDQKHALTLAQRWLADGGASRDEKERSEITVREAPDGRWAVVVYPDRASGNVLINLFSAGLGATKAPADYRCVAITSQQRTMFEYSKVTDGDCDLGATSITLPLSAEQIAADKAARERDLNALIEQIKANPSGAAGVVASYRSPVATYSVFTAQVSATETRLSITQKATILVDIRRWTNPPATTTDVYVDTTSGTVRTAVQ